MESVEKGMRHSEKDLAKRQGRECVGCWRDAGLDWTEREIFDGLSGGVRIHARQAPFSLVVEQEQLV
jgi:hypothetical protein